MKYPSLLLGLALCLHVIASAGVVAPGAKPVKVSSDFSFTEGPAADRDGNVYFTDQPNDRIVRWGVDGTVSDWMKPSGRSNGMYFDRAGNLLTCADAKNELWSIAPDKKVTVLAKDFEGKLFNGPNDLWITPAGDFYFTDPLYSRPYWEQSSAQRMAGEYVYFFERKTGKVSVVERELVKPNGIIGTPDGKTLYVADIGANKTYVYHIAADHSLTDKKLFCSLGSDGMTMDAEGNVYLTGKGVTVFNSKGEQIEHIDIDEPWTANVTFGGKDRTTLFITASKSIYTVAMCVQGAH